MDAPPASCDADAPREERTLVFTDIVGSMPLKVRLGDPTALGMMERHDAMLRACLARFPGALETERAGDSFLLIFPRPADAVHFALLFQRELRGLAAEMREKVLDRIGIHVAEIALREEAGLLRPVRSIHLDVCARIMGGGSADQILLSRAAFDAARAALSAAELEGFSLLSWLNHGCYALKDIEEPIEICEVGEQGLAAPSAPASSAKLHRVTTAEGEPVLGWRPALEQQVPGTAWILERLLGTGGFGEVWLARNAMLRQQRVFKFCFRIDRVRSLKRELVLFRLLRERVGEHRNIVTVHDVYFDDAPFYLAMEYVEGADLLAWAPDLRAVPLATRLEIVAQVADALQVAHEAGIIHRDVKPSNILIGSKPGPLLVKLTDFGIGQLVSRETLPGVTQFGFTHTMLSRSSADGTQLYLSPELLAGEAATTSSDIYSLGIVLWQIIAGDFKRPLTTDWAEKIEDPLLVEDLRKCFASDAGERFSAAQLAAHLRSLDERRSGLAAERGRLAALERRAYRRGALRTAGIALLALLLVAGLAAFGFHQAGRARASAAAEAVSRGNAEALVAGMQLRRADDYLAEGNAAAGLAYLATIVRRDPRNAVAAERLLAVLRDRNFALQTAAPLRQEGGVTACAFSPDGDRLVTISLNTASVWNAQTGERLAGPLPQGGSAVAYSADARYFVIAGDSTQIFDAQTTTVKYRVDAPCRIERPTLFNPNGKQLLTLTETGTTAQLWNVEDGTRAGADLTCSAQIESTQFSPDGTLLALGCADGRTHLWDLQTGEHVHALAGDGGICRIVFRPGGRQLTTGSRSGEVQRWEVASGKAVGDPLAHRMKVTDVDYSPDGNLILSTSDDGTMRLWDANSGAPRGELEGNAYRIYCGNFTKDGQRIVTRTGQGTVLVWDVAKRTRVMEPILSESHPETVVFSPDGHRLAVGCADGVTSLWDIDRAAAEPLALDHHAAVTATSFSPDEREILTAGNDGQVRFWDRKTGVERAPSLRLERRLRDAQFSSDGRAVLTVTEDDAVQLWDAGKAIPLGPPMPGAHVLLAQTANDGRAVLIVRQGGGAQIWDGTNGQPLSARLCETPTQVALSADGGKAAIGTPGELGVWAIPGGAQIASTSSPFFASLALSPSGRLLAAGSRDYAVRIWKVENGTSLVADFQPPNVARTVEFSRDERLVATTSFDRAVHLWTTATGQRAGEVLAHSSFLLGTAFSPVDSRRLLTACDDGARLWDTTRAALLAEPLRLRAGAQQVRFSADGQQALILPVNSNHALVWELPQPPEQAPEWLADWAEAVGGRRLDAAGALSAASRAGLARVQDAVRLSKSDDLYTRTARWFFTPQGEQPISPLSSVGREELKRRNKYPERAALTGPAQIDLTQHYNCRLDEPMVAEDVGNDLEDLAPGLHEFDGVTFDVRGVVQLGNQAQLARFPREVRGIAVGRACRTLHFLQSAAYASAPAETELARYVVHYADGTELEIPQLRGRDLSDWWTEHAAPTLRVAWKGSNPFARARNESLSIFLSSWQNPRPDAVVASIDFLATHELAAPFVLAITAE